MRTRFAIVGGGIMGLSIALELARRTDPLSDPVVLFERAPALGAGSSGRSGAILRQHYADLAVARVARDALQLWKRFETKTGRSVGFRETGVLTLAGPRAPQWIERVRRNVEALRGIGVDTELLDAAGIRARVPGIAVDDECVGAWEPGGGAVDPARALEAFAGLARTHGAVTRLGAEVRALRIEDGRAVGLETDEGPVEAETVIVAAGPWSRALLEHAGCGLPLRVVRPEQHFVALPRSPAGSASARGALGRASGRSVPDLDSDLDDPVARIERAAEHERSAEPAPAHPVVIDLELGFYTRCETHRARTRVGHIDHADDLVLDDPDDLEEGIGDAMRAFGRRVLTERLPMYAEREDSDGQAAWYTLTPDSQPLLGPVPGLAGALVATGFSGHGFKLAPAIGEGMSQLALGETVAAFDRAFFDPARFLQGGVPGAVDWESGSFGL